MKYEILGRETESFGPLQMWSSQSLLKIALRQTEVFYVVQLWIVMGLFCTHKLNKFMPGIYVYLTYK